MQMARNLRNSDPTQERLRRELRLARPLSCSFKTNVLKQEFSMTYSQNKTEETFILDSVGN